MPQHASVRRRRFRDTIPPLSETIGLVRGAEASALSSLNKDQIAERGARLARRDDRAYREYVREEQRRQPGCPAREVVLDQRGQATKRVGRGSGAVNAGETARG